MGYAEEKEGFQEETYQEENQLEGCENHIITNITQILIFSCLHSRPFGYEQYLFTIIYNAF